MVTKEIKSSEDEIEKFSDSSTTFPNNTNSPANSMTFLKEVNTSTPIHDHELTVTTPKKRVAHHNKTLSAKLETINTSLTAIESTFIFFVNKISQLKMTTDQIVPNIVANQKQINPQDNLENKIKHCSTSLDSIHTI